MMGFGHMRSGAGVGNSSSSTSNLSALAPPFTVDRLNPKPNSNPNFHFSDSPYPVEPYSHTWQYAPPSAPGPELIINSTGITSVPLSHDYQFSASASISPSSTHWSALSPCTETSGAAFGYPGEVKPYHSPYVPPVVGGGGLFVDNEGPTSGLSVTSQIDVFDLKHGRWMEPWDFDDGKRAKRVELNGSFLAEKANVGDFLSNQGGRGTENRNKSKEDSGSSYKRFNQLSDREVHTGSLNIRHMEDKSCLEQNLGFFTYDSNKTSVPVPASSSTYPEANPSAQPCEMLNNFNFSNYQDSYSPYEKCDIGPVDNPFTAPVSAIKSSPTVVIRPPPATNVNLEQSVVSHSDNVGGTHNVDFDRSNPSKKNNSFETNLFNFSNQGNAYNDDFDHPNPSKTNNSFETNLFNFSNQGNSFDGKIRRFGSKLPDTNASGGVTMACDNDNGQVVNSTQDSSDFVDHHSTAEDSPCWKGAPSSSKFSKGDVDAGNFNPAKKKLEEYYAFDHEMHQNIHSIIDSGKVREGSKNKKNECARNFDAVLSSKEHSLLDAGMTLNDVSEGGAVAVHAAEKVLDSPAPQEDATECTKSPLPNLNVPTMIKAIHNLSQLVLFHVSDGACSLEEENTEALKNIISNLDLCLSKKTVSGNNKQEPNNSVGDTSEKVGESLNVGTTSGSPHMMNEAANSSVKKLHYQHMHEEERNYGFLGKKHEKLPNLSPVKDDLDIMKDDDNMAKAIKKVLEDNFYLSEEMDSQTLLFKNLWLEAEAKLCSISYKARFDRMKIQMEETKHKAPPQENEDIAEMTSKFCIPIAPITADELGPKARDGNIPVPVSQNMSTSNMAGHGDDNEASVMARFHILKSREDNTKPTDVKEEQQPEMIDGDHAGSIMAQFNILKSWDGNSKGFDYIEEENQPEVIDGDHASLTMDRLNILKSQDESSKLGCVEEEHHEMTDCDRAHARSIMTRFAILRSRENSKPSGVEEEKQPEDETSNEALKPHLLLKTACSGEDKFGSYGDGAGWKPLNEFHLSFTNDLPIHPYVSTITSQSNWGRHDGSSSSSDWEHVLKDDFAWKNL